MKLLPPLAVVCALLAPTPQARAENRSVLIVVTHDKDGRAKVTIHSDDKADRREAVTVEEASKGIAGMKGWGSAVGVFVVTDRVLARKDRKALFDTIDANSWLDLSYYGGNAPKNLAEHFLKPGGGWRLTAKGPKAVKAGSPVPLALTLKNGSDGPLVYGEVTGVGSEHVRGITVRDKDGKAVPLTRFGERWSTGPEAVMRFVSRTVKPGEEATVTLDLARYFDLSLPGTYTIAVEHRFAYLTGEAVGGKRAIVVSDPVTIEVSDAEETGAWEGVDVVAFRDFDDIQVKLGGKAYKAFLVGLRPLREGDKDQQEKLRKDVTAKLRKNALSARVVTTRGEAVGLSVDAFMHHKNDFGHPWDPKAYPYCWSGWGAYNLNAWFLHVGVTKPLDNFGGNERYREQFAEVVKMIEDTRKTPKQ